MNIKKVDVNVYAFVDNYREVFINSLSTQIVENSEISKEQVKDFVGRVISKTEIDDLANYQGVNLSNCGWKVSIFEAGTNKRIAIKWIKKL